MSLLDKIANKSLRQISLNLTDIAFDSHNPRKRFDPDELQELAQSIARYGVLVPVLVVPTQNSSTPYRLVSGERRVRASMMLDRDTIPAIPIPNEMSPREAALVDNIARVNLTHTEKTLAIIEIALDELQMDRNEFNRQINLYVNYVYSRDTQTVSEEIKNKISEITPLVQFMEDILSRVMNIRFPSWVSNKYKKISSIPQWLLQEFLDRHISEEVMFVMMTVKNDDKRKELIKELIQEGFAHSKEDAERLVDLLDLKHSKKPPVRKVKPKQFMAFSSSVLQAVSDAEKTEVENLFKRLAEILKIPET